MGSLLFAGTSCILYCFVGTVEFFQGTMLMLMFTAFLICFIWNSLAAGGKSKLLALVMAIHYETIIVGTLEIQQKEQLFTVRILLNIPE